MGQKKKFKQRQANPPTTLDPQAHQTATSGLLLSCQSDFGVTHGTFQLASHHQELKRSQSSKEFQGSVTARRRWH
jgi:hypothetical protein